MLTRPGNGAWGGGGIAQGDRPYLNLCALRLCDGWLCVLTTGIVNRPFDRMRKLSRVSCWFFHLGSLKDERSMTGDTTNRGRRSNILNHTQFG